jgi:hypothetical protein
MDRLSILRAALIPVCCVLSACAERPSQVAPAPVTAPASPADRQIYVVVGRDQSLDKIAQTYRVAKQDIIAANQLKPPYSLKPGTVLTIPGGVVQPSTATTPPKPAEPSRAAGNSDQTAPARPRQTRPKRPAPEVIPLD